MSLPRLKIYPLSLQIYPLPLQFTRQELEYIGAAVGQFDIEFEPAPKNLKDKLNSYAERNGINTNGWAK